MKAKKAVPTIYPGMQDRTMCDDIGFEHLWKDTTPNITYATMPPSYPPKTRECVNCGIKQKQVMIQREIKEWHPVDVRMDSGR